VQACNQGGGESEGKDDPSVGKRSTFAGERKYLKSKDKKDKYQLIMK